MSSLLPLNLKFKLCLKSDHDGFSILSIDDNQNETTVHNGKLKTDSYAIASMYFVAIMNNISSRNIFTVDSQNFDSYYERTVVFKLSEEYDDNLNRRW